MELQLTDEQKLLRETTIRFITDTCPLDQVRRLCEGQAELDPGYHSTAAELGWFSMLVPEDRGGANLSGEGLRDLAIVAEERGRWLQQGPFVGTNILAHALGAAPSRDNDDILDRLLNGEASAAWVMGASSWSAGPGIDATRDGNEYRLAGQVRMVQEAAGADYLLVSARESAATGQFLLAADHGGVTVAPVRSLDITQRFATVTLDDAVVAQSAMLGNAVNAEDALARQLAIALVLIVAETVGAADALFSLTTEYTKQRTAFGRPIGSFQALKHQLADLSLALESSKAIAVEATRGVQSGSADGRMLASIAKVWTSEMATEVAQGCLQLFGGIGYTWEHDLHLYLRRLTINNLLYGSPRWHRSRIWSAQPSLHAAELVGGRQ